MLVPAILYKNDIEEKLRMRYYTDEYFYYVGGIGADVPEIVPIDSEGTEYQYACLVDDRIEGYFSFKINWNSRMMYYLSIYGFGSKRYTFIKEVLSMILMVIHEWKVHRVEWCCVEGNKSKPMYDRFIKKIGGMPNILYKRDVLKDRTGKYHGIYIYEVIY